MNYRSCSNTVRDGLVILQKAKRQLTVLLTIAVIFVFCTGMSADKQQKQYFEAVSAMDEGDYEAAIEAFEDLNGYKDSEELLKESYYLYAGQLLDEGKIKSASVIYQDLSGYKEADTYIQLCSDASIYYGALDLYEKGEYLSAYDAMGSMSGKYKDSRQLEAKCILQIAKQHYEDKDYETAYDWYFILQDSMDDLPKGTDTAFVKKIPLRYAESLINVKTDASVNKGLEILRSMKSTSEIKKLITKGEKQLNQNRYDEAAEYLKNRQYTKAVDAFAKIKDFSDAKKQWLKAMYEYVQANKDGSGQSQSFVTKWLNKKDETLYEYAKVLAKNNYKDSKAYYKELTAWKVDIVMNGDPDTVTSATSVSKYDNVYAHVELSGGPLEGKTKLKAVFTLPNGSKVTVNWKEKWQEGDTGYAYCYYNEPHKGKSGTCKVKIYDGDGNVIGQSQIKMHG